MAKLVPKRKLRSQDPQSPIGKENTVPDDEGHIREVILAADKSDSHPEISTDREESGEDNNGESMNDKEDGDSEGGEYSDGDEGDESSGNDKEVDKEARNFVLDVMKDNLASAGPRDAEDPAEYGDQGNEAGEIDGQFGNPIGVDESNSLEDKVPEINTIGDVPLEWYKNKDHISYTKEGLKIKKQAKRDELDTFLARTEDATEWRKVYDEYTDKKVKLF